MNHKGFEVRDYIVIILMNAKKFNFDTFKKERNGQNAGTD